MSSAIKSPTRLVIERLMRNKAAFIGATVLLALYLSAVFAAFLAPYSAYSESPTSLHHPPHRLHFFDQKGHFHIRPFVYRYKLTDIASRAYITDQSKRYEIHFFVKGEPYKLWGWIPMTYHLFGVRPEMEDSLNIEPVRIYLLGADAMGRDVFSRILFGAQISLSIGLVGIAITMTLGMLIGGVSGYFGGAIDTLIMRFVELIMSIPDLYLILALRAAIHNGNPLLRHIFGLEAGELLSSGQTYLVIIVILGFVGWGGTARVIRGIVLGVRELDYVRAAQAMGASHLRIITRHLLPNTFTYVIVASTLAVPSYILGEAALSFLGVGIEDPTPSWGLMLRDALNLKIVQTPWLLAPGVFIFITVFAFNFLGDGLRDALDPKSLS